MKTIIQIDNLSKKYQSQTIFDNASLHILEGQKIGLVGRNGAGKSTLCRMIIDQEEPDCGTILKSSDLRLSYLEQHDPFEHDEVVVQFLMRYTEQPEWKCCKVAHQFQITDEQLKMQIGELSGGYQTRIKFAAMLLREPNFLILDEPTNYLDLTTLILIENFLKTDYKGGFIIVSHDREFLKKTCDQTLDVVQNKLSFFPGPIDAYMEYKDEKQRHVDSHNKNVMAKQKQLQQFIDRFSAKTSKARQAQSKVKQIKRLESLEVVKSERSVNIRLPEIQKQRGSALECKDLAVGYPDKVIARKISFFIPSGAHVAILGDNGQGKTTFLRTLANDLQVKAGEFQWGHQLSIGYYAQHVYQSINPEFDVYTYLRNVAADSIRDQEVLDMAGSFLFSGDDVNKRVKTLSGGERARLCLAGILLTKHQVLLLDEPTNHLDFETVEALADALQRFNGTLFFISHDRTFVNMVASEIVEVKNGYVKRYSGNYEEYVYFLSEKIEQDLLQQAQVEKELNKPKPAAIDRKKVRAGLRNIEKELKKAEKEKKQLEVEFADSANAFSVEKKRRYKELEDLIDNLEAQWISEQEQLAGA
ncbi:ABC-F family ATP-binding cassette domain-containing protein [bacterium]|jgi:ATP-binding cassette, subfamily F, member 3|nr:ABC-F family ATP-binding cassette domain-containing protein [bacterium]MBT5015576.1 ABC-F family ATP-binding cassette domain-containing protein [bacterium]